jgi:hypothetical protein
MKNLKKISAVVVALAIMVTTLVPAFAASTTVNESKSVVLNKLDLYAGTSTSSFVPSLETELTRGQGATLLTKLFNMDDAALALTDAQADAIIKDFADADKVPTYAKKRLAYLVQNDIMSGSLDGGKLYINADESLLGGQFATLVLKQMGFTVDSWKTSIAQLANVEGAKDLATYLSYATDKLIRDQAVGIMFGSLTAKYADGSATIIEKLVAAKPALKDAAVAAGLIVLVNTALTVESVKTLNAKQIEISFNNAVDKTSAEDESFYEIKDKGTNVIALGADSAKLSDDGKTVVITLDAAAADKLTNSTDAKITVKKDLLAVSSVKLVADYVNASVKVTDGVIPSVQKVEAIGDTTLRMTFTEPVYNGTSLAIANQNITVKSGNYTYYVQNAVADAAKKTITLTVGTKLIEGPITVTVNAAGVEVVGAIQDYAGYKVFRGETSFNYVKDTTVPVVTVKEAKQESITLAFSKPVKAADLKLFHSVNNIAAYQATAVTTAGYVDEITFNFTNKVPAGSVKLFLVNSTVSGSELVDGFGIKVPDQTLNINIVVDVTGPVVSSTKINTNASYDIIFDEAIDATQATNTSNYSFKSVADGKNVIFTVGYNAATNAKKVTLNVPGNLSDTTQYQVVVKAMKDISGNSMASEAAYTFTVGDYTNPTVSDAYAVNADGKIYVTFSEPMNAVQMADKTNYAVKTTGGAIFAALGDNDTVTALSNKSIVIKIDNATVSTPSLKIAGITDLAGKKMGSDVDFVYAAPIVTNIGQEQVKVTTAELVAKNKIKLTFNKEISTFDNTEFSIVDKATGLDLTPAAIRIQSVESMTKNSDGYTEVVLVIDTDVNTDALFLTQAIDVKTVATPANTKSTSGTILAGTIAVTVTDKLSAEVVKYDDDSNANTETVAKVIASNFSTTPVNGIVGKDVTAKISVYFTENMSMSSISTLTFNVDGYTVTGVALNADNSIVELTVKANADNTTAKPSVSQVYNITDANSNVFAAGSVWAIR